MGAGGNLFCLQTCWTQKKRMLVGLGPIPHALQDNRISYQEFKSYLRSGARQCHQHEQICVAREPIQSCKPVHDNMQISIHVHGTKALQRDD